MFDTHAVRVQCEQTATAFRSMLNRAVARHRLTAEERANLAAGRPHAAIYSASLGYHATH
ncbi:hypothetical protein [Nocardia stercoris]|uniref:Uncharacterized protein n=1 Tax=Nocardia stercoris TaxID=2483361 RepID=A0A3M2KU35_9NOCA|nr:hypothetical protein [Nocardia stercoris]RMI27970.1 hypothetical protein EBN03_31975 [Nocardia stercoris]